MSKATIIVPLPSEDFDPSEVAVPWQILKQNGYDVEFATVDGKCGCADPLMLSGEGLDPWGWIPGLKKIRLIGLLLRADRFGRAAYRQLEQDPNFKAPKTWEQLKTEDYDGLLLPGGHAPKMKQYLESKPLQKFVAEFFECTDQQGRHKPVAAVCHGVVLAARSISPTTKKSVLYGKKTTALTWKLEKSAWLLTKLFARFWDSGYYRTYLEYDGEPLGYNSVEHEVTRALQSNDDFVHVTLNNPHYFVKTAGLFRDRPDNDKAAWVVEDGHYISGRWPGDVHTLGQKLVKQLDARY